MVVGETSYGLDQVPALLWCLLRLAGQEESAGGGDVPRELQEGVEHVESVEVNRGRGHGVVSQSEGLADLLDKPDNYQAEDDWSDLTPLLPGPLPPVPRLMAVLQAPLVTRCVLQLFLLVIPLWHLSSPNICKYK